MKWKKQKGNQVQSNLVFTIPSINNKYLILPPHILIPRFYHSLIMIRRVSKRVISRQGKREGEVMSVQSDQSRDTLQRLVDMERVDQSKLLLVVMVTHFILSLLEVIKEVASVLMKGLM